MPRRWRINQRRADGSRCFHYSDEPCEACEADRRKPALVTPRAFSFGMAAAGLEQTVFAPWEKPHDITSRTELLDFCEKNNLDSQYLKDSMHFPHRKPREQ